MINLGLLTPELIIERVKKVENKIKMNIKFIDINYYLIFVKELFIISCFLVLH